MIGPQAIVIVAAVHACRLLSVSIATAATAHGAWGGPLRWPVGGGIIGSGGARGVLAFHSVPAVAAGLARNDGGVSVRSHCSGQRCRPLAALPQDHPLQQDQLHHNQQEQQQAHARPTRRRTRFYPRWGQGEQETSAGPGAGASTCYPYSSPASHTEIRTLHFELQQQWQRQQSYSPQKQRRSAPRSSVRGALSSIVSDDDEVGGGVGRAAAAAATATGVGRGSSSSTGAEESQSRSAGRKRFSGVLASSFQHPFDLEATALLRRLPGLELVVRSVVPAIEDVVYMDNIANSILVGPNQMASLHSLLLEACRILDIEQVPDMYIRQNPAPNAYTLAIRGKKPFIVLHTSLVDLMEPKEVQAVIAHELGHLKCEHGIWVTLATVLANGLYRGGFLGALVADRLGLQRTLMRWSRAAEFTCDRAAMLVAQDVNVVVSTLLKLAGGSVSQASELSVPEFLKQASAYDLASKTRIGQLLKNSQSEELTHPLPVIRARELVKFSKSAQYLGLLRRGVQL